jgi:serine/threonine-protein kinase
MKEPLLINTTISHYRLISQLGAGGMGEVYLAEDTQLDRKVAIKFLPSESAADEQARKRLIREARAAAKARTSEHLLYL